MRKRRITLTSSIASSIFFSGAARYDLRCCSVRRTRRACGTRYGPWAGGLVCTLLLIRFFLPHKRLTPTMVCFCVSPRLWCAFCLDSGAVGNTAEVTTTNIRSGAAFDNLKASWGQVPPALKIELARCALFCWC